MVFSYVQNEQQSAQYLETHSSINLEYELKSLRDVIHQKEMLLTDGRKHNWHFTYQEIGENPFKDLRLMDKNLKKINKINCKTCCSYCPKWANNAIYINSCSTRKTGKKRKGGKKVDSPAETSFSLKSDAHYTLLTDNPMSPLQALMHIIKYSNIKN